MAGIKASDLSGKAAEANRSPRVATVDSNEKKGGRKTQRRGTESNKPSQSRPSTNPAGHNASMATQASDLGGAWDDQASRIAAPPSKPTASPPNDSWVASLRQLKILSEDECNKIERFEGNGDRRAVARMILAQEE